MKTPILISALVIVLVGLIIGVSFYYASFQFPSDSHQDNTAPPSDSIGQLKINNLAASTDGTVSLDITLVVLVLAKHLLKIQH